MTVPDPVASSPDPQNPAPALVTQPNDPTVTAPNPIANLDIAFLSNTPRAGDDVAVSVQARDANNAPVTGQSLILALSTGRDFEKTYALLEGAPGGLYTATVNSTWAGTYRVGVRQGTIAVGTTKSLTFLPADPSTISLKLATPQEKSSSKREAVVSAVLRDSFGNVVDSLARDYRVTTSVGKIKSVEKRGQEIAITAEADAWGVANISVSHLTRSVQDAANTIDVPFSPIVLDIPKGVQTGASFSVPVYIFLPPASGKIGGYRFTLNYWLNITSYPVL
ncbi:MAG: hypothetical protein UY05_C0018G0020 [Candidatus Peregrinibacteria bacterium GW2011_GWA2_47_7]|nr:MAG: hypothetical protein UY05_C0018G0020 [Candidatus Peregrinibacteria bacterium GW2011_GWA2_47_7]